MEFNPTEPMTEEDLVAALGDARPRVRLQALSTLRRRPPEAAFAALLAGLSHPRATVQRRAAEALGKWGDRRAVEPLIGLLQGTTVLVRLTAIQSLVQLGDVRALPALRRLARFWQMEDLGFSLEGLARIRQAARQAIRQWERGGFPPNTALSRSQSLFPPRVNESSLSHNPSPEGSQPPARTPERTS